MTTDFYHGSTTKFAPGDTLTPEGAAKHGHYERISRGYVHMADDKGTAASYAASRLNDYGGHGAHVYQVCPTGSIERDPGSAWPTFRTTGSLRVVREVPGNEWDEDE